MMPEIPSQSAPLQTALPQGVPSQGAGLQVADNMAGWLAVNRLTVDGCIAILSDMPAEPAVKPQQQEPISRSLKGSLAAADKGWQVAHAAIMAALPGLASLVPRPNQVTLHAGPAAGKPRAAFTLDRGPQAPPLVSLYFTGTPADLIALAHECGHAMQIMASHAAGTGVMPPLAREVCAFLAELTLLDHMALRDKETYGQLCTAHRADDRRYLGDDAERLRSALANGMADREALYDHRWNYPLARIWASRIWVSQIREAWLFGGGDPAVQDDRMATAKLFAAGGDAPACLARLLKEGS